MIEPANGLGEPVREIGEKAADGVSVWFRNISRGKRSLKLNLKDPDALAAFYKLAAEVDVVVEAFRPGVVQRLGVDYETLRGINPGIVYCSISAFGQDSSLARKPAHDLTVQGMAGLVDLNRGQDDQPAMPSIPFADASASLMALSAILMALYRRSITGRAISLICPCTMRRSLGRRMCLAPLSEKVVPQRQKRCGASVAAQCTISTRRQMMNSSFLVVAK